MTEQIRLLDQEGKLCVVHISDLISIKPTSDGPEFYTKDNMYYYPTTLDELLIVLKDYGFDRLDRTNLVNMNHLESYDPKARKVYFDAEVTKDSKYATVSEANIVKVEHLAKEEITKYRKGSAASRALTWATNSGKMR
ncbi:MAG: LytTR family transcriptional regulator DNA-binding domain-containing protein [Candidatus Cohnella colombiensis]|uniref:LytTR family transcriptional regulator DNA-binding domain-containing protein n=1 Tax=Candidatus Cohnella colombiensis TaxID=3121368 RepID=A0AA95EXD9_9BACL|nr:MAG: LytTR family transcriptional regulator DNA-binding domain-containing protein [Cohnella sp.]